MAAAASAQRLPRSPPKQDSSFCCQSIRCQSQGRMAHAEPREKKQRGPCPTLLPRMKTNPKAGAQHLAHRRPQTHLWSKRMSGGQTAQSAAKAQNLGLASAARSAPNQAIALLAKILSQHPQPQGPGTLPCLPRCSRRRWPAQHLPSIWPQRLCCATIRAHVASTTQAILEPCPRST